MARPPDFSSLVWDICFQAELRRGKSITKAWAKADEARACYMARTHTPRGPIEAPALPSGNPAVKRRKKK